MLNFLISSAKDLKQKHADLFKGSLNGGCSSGIKVQWTSGVESCEHKSTREILRPTTLGWEYNLALIRQFPKRVKVRKRSADKD